MDSTSNSHEIIANETTPLVVPAKDSKKTKTPLPKLQIGILITLQLAEPIASTSIFPYINQLIGELGITGGDDAAVGYYAGIIESLFFVAQALTVLKWSRLSDRIGRRPVLVIGLSGACISILCFGLSTTFWSLPLLVWFSKWQCGGYEDDDGGIDGLYKYGSGIRLDPDRLVHWRLYWEEHLHDRKIIGLHYSRTLSTKRWPKFTSTRVSVSSSPDRESLVKNSMANMPLRSLLTPSVVIPIANYAMVALLDVSFRVLMPLFFSTPTYLGGLGFDPAVIGSWLALFGIIDAFILRLSVVLRTTHGYVSNNVVDFMIVIWHTTYGTIYMFITASAPTNNVLGAINGLSQTSAAVARAIGPALATSLFAVSKEHNLLGGNAVFVVLIVLAGGLRWLASQLPDEVQDRDE
ncbi:MFS transporter [Suillus discolor]|uniref:MFS transporter n=1 Tax=Suillus discolor TaxID=1912936 RepID=A0A9P7EZW5_9AGAM|nr:MFS transporter [Suillus discolor]KAG2100401.1 MFS transporter [Suillus discolor]